MERAEDGVEGAEWPTESGWPEAGVGGREREGELGTEEVVLEALAGLAVCFAENQRRMGRAGWLARLRF